jgi:hypothetical protein
MSGTKLTQATEQSFMQLCDSISTDAHREFEFAKRDIRRGEIGSGVSPGSGQGLAMTDHAAGEIVRKRAGEIFANLMQAHDAEPSPDIAGRITYLQELLGPRVENLGRSLQMSMERARGQSIAGHKTFESREVPRAVGLALQEYKARIQITVTTAKNRGLMAQSIHVGPNANVGAIQIGTNQTATVSQTIGSANREEFKAAMDALINVVRAGSAAEVPARGELIDLLEDVKAEAEKPSPNKLKISSSLSVAGASVSMLANAPAAITNVLAAWDALKGMLSQ